MPTKLVDNMADTSTVRQPPAPTDHGIDLDDAGGHRRWMQSAHAGHVSSLGWGAAPGSVVAVHDLGEAATRWAAAGALVPGGLVAVDLPGHGRSSASDGPPPTPARASLALLDAVWSFAPRTPLVVGRGHGAAAALAGARRRPDRIRAVAVLATPGAAGAIPVADVAAITVPVLLLRPRDVELDPVARAVVDAGDIRVVEVDGRGDVVDTAPGALATALAAALAQLADGASR
jgi:pimeloyl-ACP methyl ester carboxylesterase